jgi:hypothetical protein
MRCAGAPQPFPVEGVMLLFMLACSVPEGASELDSDQGPDDVEDLECGVERDELDIDPDNACHDGDQLLVESGYDAAGTHFAWTVEDCFVAAGGSVPEVDAPSVMVQCPPCGEPGTRLYAVDIDITDDEGRSVAWGFGTVPQVCADE